MKSLVILDCTGYAGSSSLTFHLAHMFARKGKRTLVVDLDPQCSTSARFLDQRELSALWVDPSLSTGSVAGCLVASRMAGGEGAAPEPLWITSDLWILAGGFSVGLLEQDLAVDWNDSIVAADARALARSMVIERLSRSAALSVDAEYVLLGIGPNLGALSRATVLASDGVLVPLAPDPFGLEGMRTLGAALRRWREESSRLVSSREWAEVGARVHSFRPLGYIAQPSIPLMNGRDAQFAYHKWIRELPFAYQSELLGDPVQSALHDEDSLAVFENHPECLANLRHFAGLGPPAEAAGKPMFDLKQADGIGSSQMHVVARCRAAFEGLTDVLWTRLDVLTDAP